MLDEAPGHGLDRGPRFAPTSVVRRLVRRALWPDLEEQRRLDTATLEALAALQRSVDDLDARVQLLERETLGTPRRATAPEAQLSAKRVTSSSSPSAPEYS